MLNVVHEVRGLCKRNCDGAHSTRGDRIRSLSLMGRQLNAMGFKQMNVTSLKEKHVEALLKRWKSEGLVISTIKKIAYLTCVGGRRKLVGRELFPPITQRLAYLSENM